MYEKAFGLKKRPFSSRASGADVFVGPQTANTVQSLKKALAAADAAVAVTGPAGVGKTTVVHRALDTIDKESTRIRIGRMQLRHDEVLEFLLEELGASNLPASTIRRISLFRDLLEQRRAAGHRVCIVVEDALRIGEDALAELEALTAADNGDSEGANLILMAADSLRDHLRSETLTRLNQRVRVQHRVEAFSEAELRAYLKHCLRSAGADFDLLFADDAVAAIHGCSEGIARSANTLVDAVLVAAAERNVTRVDAALIADVAGDDFALTIETRIPDFGAASAESDNDDTDATASETAPAEEAASPAPAEAAQPAPQAPAAKPKSEADLEVESGVYDSNAAKAAEPSPEPAVEAAEPVAAEAPAEVAAPVAAEVPAEPAPVMQADAESAAPAVDAEPVEAQAPEAESVDVPDLIQDTQPELAVLTPDNMPIEDTAEAADDSQSIPTLFSSTRMQAPLAEPATLSEDETGAKLVIGEDAEPAASVESAAQDTPAEPELPAAPAPVAEVQPADEPAAPEAATEAPAAPEMALADDTPAPVEPAAEALEAAPAAEAPAPVAEPAPVELSLADDSAPAAPEAEASAPEETPAWDRDPTLAELRPDLAALENAMAEFSEEDLAPPPEPEPEPTPEPELSLAESGEFGVPEITLDQAIQEKIDEAQAALEKHDATIAEGDAEELGAPEAAAAEAPAAPASEEKVPESFRDTQELKQVAGKLAQGASLEEMDDRMAETLFGVELGNISEEILADQAAANSANEANAAPAPQSAAASAATAPAANAPAASAPAAGAAGAANMTATQRLATVRALNAAAGTSQPAPPQPAAPVEKPAPIEDQMKEMTASFEAPKFDLPDDDEDDDDDTGEKKGFFSRFRRS